MDDFDDLFEDETPPISTQIWNFIKSMGRVFWAFVTLKKVRISESGFILRIGACMDCENCLNKKRCKLCGCFIHQKAKLLTEKCPAEKWNK